MSESSEHINTGIAFRVVAAFALSVVGAVRQASAGIEFTPEDARIAYCAAAALVTNCTPRDAGTLRGMLAADWILDRVSRTGVDARKDMFRDMTPHGERTFSNVVVEFQGTASNAQWIVLMSHFDTAPNIGQGFQGANDGASTSGLLMALAAAIRRSSPHKASIALVWTDGEECRVNYGPNDGFHGSRHLAGQYRAARRKVKAAICLDMLGDRNLNILIPANVSENLRRTALQAAANVGLSGIVASDTSLIVSDDHSAFLAAGFPSIDLIDFDFGSAPGRNDWWHTPQDTLDKISTASLLSSGRLVAAFLNLL